MFRLRKALLGFWLLSAGLAVAAATPEQREQIKREAAEHQALLDFQAGLKLAAKGRIDAAERKFQAALDTLPKREANTKLRKATRHQLAGICLCRAQAIREGRNRLTEAERTEALRWLNRAKALSAEELP